MEPAQVIVVDGANVVGSRPDGWWRDRAGGARRLLGQLEHLAATAPGQRIILVGAGAAGGVQVVAAPGSGDDTILDLAGRLAGQPGGCVVVTADRELRRWCLAAGASVAGPGWLFARL